MLSNPSLSLSVDAQQKWRLALDCQQGGRLDQAAALLQELLDANPRHPDLLGQLGALRLQRGHADAALPLLERAREAAPGNARYWVLQTECLLALGRAKAAKKLIAEAARNGLRHPLVERLLGQPHAGRGQKAAQPLPLQLRRLDELCRAGRHAELKAQARELLGRQAGVPQAWYLLGMAELALGETDAAARSFERALKLDPGMVEAQFNLGYALDRLGRLEASLAAYRRAASQAPQLAEAHNNLGSVLQKLGRHDEALAAYEAAAALRPQAAEYQLNRGNALREMGRPEQAVEAYQAALGRKPDLTEASLNLSVALSMLGRHDESAQACERGLAYRPDSYDLHLNLGHALRELRRNEAAVEAYRRTVALRPDEAEAHKNLGVALKAVPRYEEALACLQRAVDLNPALDSAYNAMASVLADMGRSDESLAIYRRGLEIDPDSLFTLHSNLLFALNYRQDVEQPLLLDEARRYGDKAGRKAVSAPHHANTPDPARRLRVGLVSGDLGQHPVGFFLASVVANLDGADVELFAYATTERRDELNRDLRKFIPHWCDASARKMSDEDLASRIRSDGIDVLIDLAGHTAYNRLPVFAWKPAPVQVAWLGYFATTGLAAMDYIIADRWVLPVEEEAHFVEHPWRLPDAYYCFTPPSDAVDVASLPALSNGSVTFGCFNNPRKLNGAVIDCWGRVLEAVPGSRLMLKYKGYEDASLRERISGQFARHGIEENRLIFSGQSTRAAYLEAYNEIDIALDPYPFPGGTTTIEGLWMGVPALSLRGQRFIGHQGETILNNVGLPDWVAADEDEYVAKAARFAGDLQALSALRLGLRERLLASPLCDAPRFARNLENALRGMWQNWCERQGSKD